MSNEQEIDYTDAQELWDESQQEQPMTTHADIWNTLSKIDVSEHTQDKGGLTFLSWAWAWGVMMEHYPQMTVTFHDYDHVENRPLACRFYPDGSAEIVCTVDIDGCKREMWLPIMNFSNKSIIGPSSRDVSDSKMRCMVKCFALFGLGHYIYAGEDLPQQASIENTAAHKVQAIGGKYDGMELGQIATNAGRAGLGYILWLSRNAKDDTMKLKAAEMWEAHRPDLTGNQIDDELADVESIDELTGLYRCLNDDQGTEFKDKFTVRREELEADQPKRTAENARS